MAFVLVVDDDDKMATLLCIKIQSMGHKTLVASDPLQASARIAERKPDLIVLDFMLPGGNGASLLSRLRTSVDTSRIPVILVSADIDRAKRAIAPSQGLVFHPKPIDSAMLEGQLRAFLGENSAGNKAPPGPGNLIDLDKS